MTSNVRVSMVLLAAVVISSALVASASATDAAAVQKSRVFAGYVVSKPIAHVRRVTTTFVVPTITCKKSFSGVGPSIVVQTTPNGQGNETNDIGGVGVACVGGQPVYLSVISINGGHDFNDFHFAVGDKVVVNVTVDKSRSRVTIDDLTSGAHKTRTGTGRLGATAFIGDEGVTVNAKHPGLDRFSRTRFTASQVNAESLAAQHAQPFERIRGKTVQIAVTRLSKNEDFALTFVHS
jgi:hypothetical protein